MKRLVIAAVFVMSAACSPIDHPVAGSSASPGAPAATVSPSPAALFSPPPVSIARAPVSLPPGVACRLPYAELSESAGGFVLYPGGQRLPDPAASIGSPAENTGLTYVAAAQRWVPVPHPWVAPSGQFYVYRDLQSGVIHGVNLVNLSTALVTQDGGWWPIGVTDDGVYLSRQGQPGAWYVAFGSAPVQVTSTGTWQQYGFGALWSVDSTAAIVRLDPSSGVQTNYATTANSVSFVSGFTLDGEPIVDTGGELAIYDGAGGKTEIWPGTNSLSGGSPFADQIGVWFSVGGGLIGAPGHGIYLWTAAAGPQLISTPEAYPVGPCSP